MTVNSLLAIPCLLVCFGANCQPAAPQGSGAYDGRWSVVLVCADTKDRNGDLVKGYDYKFMATISDGVLQGQYGTPGAPASITYTGQVEADGTLEIRAQGNTGKSEFAVGKLAQGTRYGYTLHGKLDKTSGEAVRREVRPCTATLRKQ